MKTQANIQFSLLFKMNSSVLRDSKEAAITRFLPNENYCKTAEVELKTCKQRLQAYIKFMDEYLENGTHDQNTRKCFVYWLLFYLPHHAVIS